MDHPKGLMLGGAVVEPELPGVRFDNILEPELSKYALKIGEDGRRRSPGEGIDLLVMHNTVGAWPIEVRPGARPEGMMAERNAQYWRSSGRSAGTQIVVEGKQVLCLADLKQIVGYGCGHRRGNGNGINFEMAALQRVGGGSVIWQEDVDTLAAVVNWLAEHLGIPKEATAPRPRGQELVRALADPTGKIRGVADHCCFTRSRGLGDTGFLVQGVLAERFGWRLIDWDEAKSSWPEAPPSWLQGPDVREITPQVQTMGGHEEIAELVALLLLEGLSIEQALEVGAHAALESGMALRDVGFNWWGWKQRKIYADQARSSGQPVLFWRRAGHPGAGDPPVCYYRAWGFPRDSIRAFLPHFCPRNAAEGLGSAMRYATAGTAFWSGAPADWFRLLLVAGYRGRQTANHPEESVQGHRRLVVEVGEAWAQSVLGVVVDGIWGPRSRAALKARVGSETLNLAALRALAA